MASSASAEATPPGVACVVVAPTAQAANTRSKARPSAAAATRIGSQRCNARDNVRMPAVSQALLEFAKHHRTEAAPGVEVTVTPRYQITLQPDFPIPGPNSISWIRCRPDEVDEVIREGRAAFAPHQQGFMWLLDPETEPSDFGDCLDRYGVHWDGDEVAVMVLPIDATGEAQEVPGLELVDGLATPESFRSADSANAAPSTSPSRAHHHQRTAILARP